MLLSQILEKSNIKIEVAKLVLDYTQRHGLPDPSQIGCVVPDVKAAAKSLEKNGVGPFFLVAENPKFWIEKGVKKEFHGRLGLGYHKGMEIEIIEPGRGSDFYKQGLEESGQPSIHHLGFQVKNLDRWIEKLGGTKKVWVKGQIASPFLFTDFAYMDTIKDAGIIIELVSMKAFGLHTDPPSTFISVLGSFQKTFSRRK